MVSLCASFFNFALTSSSPLNNMTSVSCVFFSIFADVWLEVHIYFIAAFSIVLSRWAFDEELKARALPGLKANTPAARRAASRALYRPKVAA